MRNLYYRTTSFFIVIALLTTSYQVFTNSGGPPTGNTAAPGDGNCTGCHTGSLITSGSDWNNFNISSNVPLTGYVPGTTYTITISHAVAGITRWGFQATVLNNSNAMAGTIINTSSSQMSTATSGGKTYINQNSGGNTGSGSRTWSFDWTAPNPGVGSVNVYAIVNAANNNGNVSGDQIFSKSLAITQSGVGAPVATFTNSKDTICVGDTIQFNGSGTNSPTSYSWLFINGNPGNTTQQNPKVVYNTAGSFVARLIATNSFGNSAPVTKTIVVKPKPTATIIPLGPLTICGNDSILLTANTNIGTSYLWNNGGAVSSTLYAKNAGNYSVTISANGCSMLSNTVAVSKRNKPQVTLQSNKSTTCNNDTVIFTASPSGLASYQFKQLGFTVQNTASNELKTILLLAPFSIIYVIGTDSSGCKSDSANLTTVLVQAAPSGPNVTCDSISTTFIRFAWTSIPSALGYEISLDSGKTWITPSSGNTGLSHSITGLAQATRVTAFVRAILSGPVCTKSQPGFSSCQTPGCVNLSYQLEYDSLRNVCAGLNSDTALITIRNANVSSYFYRVEEVAANGSVVRVVIPFSTSSTFQLPVVPNGINRFRINLFDSGLLGCDTVRTTIIVRTQQLVVEPFTVTTNRSNNVYCSYSSVVLIADSFSYTHVYEIYLNDTFFMSTVNNRWIFPSVLAPNGTTFKIVAVDTVNSCRIIANTIDINRKEAYQSYFTFTQTGTLEVTYTDTTPNSYKRNWYFGDGASDTAKTAVHTYASGGVYDVHLMTLDTDFCFSDSNAVQVSIFPLSLNDKYESFPFTVYPNPAKDNIFIQSDVKIEKIELIDLKGRVIATNELRKQQTNYSMDISHLANGVYLLSIISDGAHYYYQIVITHE